MKIAIDPPAKRPLNPNEQRVLGLLQEGLEPLEIARQLHMALQISNLANRHDVPPDTVMGLIASIREKGWDILDYNKEDDNMSRGQKTPVEKVREISVLKDEGKTHQQIADITGVPISTVGKICARLGKPKQKKSLHRRQTVQAQMKKHFLQLLLYLKFPQMSTPAAKFPTKIFAARSRGDTDMEAYMAEREKFFATKRGLPTLSGEAFMEKMENLREKIATAQSDIKEWTDDISKISAFIAGFIMHTEDGGVQE